MMIDLEIEGENCVAACWEILPALGSQYILQSFVKQWDSGYVTMRSSSHNLSLIILRSSTHSVYFVKGFDKIMTGWRASSAATYCPIGQAKLTKLPKENNRI